MLPALPSVILTTEGVARVAHGQDIRPEDHQGSGLNSQVSTLSPEPFVRLLNSRGDLLAIAEAARTGLLHPSVVLV
jgi:hypothetical protein